MALKREEKRLTREWGCYNAAFKVDKSHYDEYNPLASLEYGIEQGRIELGPRSVLILDEAGQVGAQTADRLLRFYMALSTLF